MTEDMSRRRTRIDRFLLRAALATALLAGAFDGGRVAAREHDAYRWLTAEEIGRARFDAGDRVRIAGRYLELQDNELVLFETPARLVIVDPRVLREVLSLTAVEINLELRARCSEPSEEPPAFTVESVAAGGGTADLLRREIRRLAEQGEPAVELLFQAARRIHRMEKRFDEKELRQLAHEACSAALELREAKLEPDDVSSRLESVRRLHEILPDRKFVMKHLVDLERRFPRADEVREFLIRIGCRRFRDRWMTYEEFKTLQGFVAYGQRWVQPSEKDFLELLESFSRLRSDPILRRMMHREYEILASRGEVAVGMQREEVYHALGFPDRVYRKKVGERVFDQWVYEDRYYYFLDGFLLKHPVGAF